MSVIDDYLAEHTGPHRQLMDELRALVTDLAPGATEALAWGMPTWKLNGNLIHVAAAKHHVGLYPGADGVAFVSEELAERGFRFSKGTIQLPVDRPIPVDLVERLVTFRVAQQEAKA